MFAARQTDGDWMNVAPLSTDYSIFFMLDNINNSTIQLVIMSFIIDRLTAW